MAVIIKPMVTEKMSKITEKMPNRYGFIVSPDANKYEIKSEVEHLYGVNVVSVNTMKYSGKRSSRYTRAGLIRGQKPAYKKAIVTIKDDQVIDFYSNI